MRKHIRIATRSSQLALWQAEWIKGQILSRFPQVTVELRLFKTQGDKILDTPLAKIGGKGLFVKELEVALLAGEADLAVHSTKDVPIELPEGLEISIYTQRETPLDALVSNQHPSFAKLPPGAKIGTCSLRRIAQLRHQRPDLVFDSLRGNVNSRLNKLDEGRYDAIVLAAAGLKRLGFEQRIQEEIPAEISLPAIGQGVVSIETRTGDDETLAALGFLDHPETRLALIAERAFLTRLNGGCQVPLGGYAVLEGAQIWLRGVVAHPDGSAYLLREIRGPQEEGARLGLELAEEMLAAGAREILTSVGIRTP